MKSGVRKTAHLYIFEQFCRQKLGPFAAPTGRKQRRAARAKAVRPTNPLTPPAAATPADRTQPRE